MEREGERTDEVLLLLFFFLFYTLSYLVGKQALTDGHTHTHTFVCQNKFCFFVFVFVFLVYSGWDRLARQDRRLSAAHPHSDVPVRHFRHPEQRYHRKQRDLRGESHSICLPSCVVDQERSNSRTCGIGHVDAIKLAISKCKICPFDQNACKHLSFPNCSTSCEVFSTLRIGTKTVVLVAVLTLADVLSWDAE